MSLEPWPPLHRQPAFRMRLIRIAILGPMVLIVAWNLLVK